MTGEAIVCQWGRSQLYATFRGRIIREGRPRAVDGYLAALRAGSTLPPLELTQMAGVDLGSREPYERFAAFFGHLGRPTGHKLGLSGQIRSLDGR
jgi:oligoendopeptidase F